MLTIERCRCLLVAVCAVAFSVAVPGAAGAERGEIFVLGTLYSRHNSVPAYDLDVLRRVVVAIDPDLAIVDCTPTEVRTRQVHASKIEYPRVIFPLAAELGYGLHAAEPDEPLFTQIVVPLADARQAFASAHADAAGALSALDTATFAALRWYWRSPSEVHDPTTAAALHGHKALDTAFHGEVQSRADQQWHEHWVAQIAAAAAGQRGRRLLAVVGIDNRAGIDTALREDARLRDFVVIDMPAWLREHGFGASAR